jgi:alkylhydroperoxidase family enzyme
MPREDLDPATRERLANMAAPIAASNYPLILAHNPAVLKEFLDNPPGREGGLLGFELREALRIRSGQLGGCDSCQQARYLDNVDADTVACMTTPSSQGDTREALAMQFLERMHLDHHSIDREFYGRLGKVFSVPEILELGMRCAGLVGGHRFVHTLDMFGEAAPVFPYKGKVEAAA